MIDIMISVGVMILFATAALALFFGLILICLYVDSKNPWLGGLCFIFSLWIFIVLMMYSLEKHKEFQQQMEVIHD